MFLVSSALSLSLMALWQLNKSCFGWFPTISRVEESKFLTEHWMGILVLRLKLMESLLYRNTTNEWS